MRVAWVKGCRLPGALCRAPMKSPQVFVWVVTNGILLELGSQVPVRGLKYAYRNKKRSRQPLDASSSSHPLVTTEAACLVVLCPIYIHISSVLFLKETPCWLVLKGAQKETRLFGSSPISRDTQLQNQTVIGRAGVHLPQHQGRARNPSDGAGR